MDDSTSNRFVSESSLKEAQERRKEEWQKAYARLGQEAPPLETPAEKYDPRTLYEKLKEQKDAKQAEFEEKHSIRNQWRHTLEDDEAHFIASVLDDKRSAEAERQAEIDKELAQFRQAVNAKAALSDSPAIASSPPLPSTSGSPPNATATSGSLSTSKALPPPKKKASQKGLLAGAIKRKSTGSEEKTVKRKLSSSTPVAESKIGSTSTDASTSAKPEAGKTQQNDMRKASATGEEPKAVSSADSQQEEGAKKRKVELS